MGTTVESTDMIPQLGSGLGYRAELKDVIVERREELDFVEVVADHFMNAAALAELEEIRTWFPVIPHALALSVGSISPVDREYLRRLKMVSDTAQSPYVSDHLCMTHVPGIEIGHLSPLWFTEEVLRHTVDKVHCIQNYLHKPLVLENVTYVFSVPGATMTQAEFFARLIDATGCGMLLDVTNLYINATNHGFDPYEFLDELPLEHVVQVHIAGGFWDDDILVDSHSHPVQEGSWKLLRTLAATRPIKGCILEQDTNFTHPEMLLNQVARAREIIAASADGTSAA